MNPAATHRLSPGHIALWCCRSSQLCPTFLAQAPQHFFNAAEHQRHQRFKFPQHQTAFTASRILLKTALGAYLGLGPQHIHFHFNPYGKPSLHPDYHPQTLEFSLTHSGDYALIALHTAPLGLDTEMRNRQTDIVRIAQYQFHPEEIAQLHNPLTQQQQGYRLWMLKEAYIKYLGKGLAEPLNSFYFHLNPPHITLGFNTPHTPCPQATLLQLGRHCTAALCHNQPSPQWQGFQLTNTAQIQPMAVRVLAQTAEYPPGGL